MQLRIRTTDRSQAYLRVMKFLWITSAVSEEFCCLVGASSAIDAESMRLADMHAFGQFLGTITSSKEKEVKGLKAFHTVTVA